MLITTGGVLIRTKVNQVPLVGRTAKGVRLINLDEHETLIRAVKVAEPDEPELVDDLPVSHDTSDGVDSTEAI
jgi:DNA gyrase subunit A